MDSDSLIGDAHSCKHCYSIITLAGHPFRGWPARLRGHKGSGLSAESAGADEPV